MCVCVCVCVCVCMYACVCAGNTSKKKILKPTWTVCTQCNN